jgi:hypothetical protein
MISVRRNNHEDIQTDRRCRTSCFGQPAAIANRDDKEAYDAGRDDKEWAKEQRKAEKEARKDAQEERKHVEEMTKQERERYDD